MKKGVLQPLWLSQSCFLELPKLSYLIWKRTFRAIYWYKNLTNSPTDRYYLNVIWGLAALNQLPSTFWSVTLQPLGADQPTIHKLKGDMPSFHMRYNGMDSSKWLHRYRRCKRLSFIGLVLPHVFLYYPYIWNGTFIALPNGLLFHILFSSTVSLKTKSKSALVYVIGKWHLLFTEQDGNHPMDLRQSW